MYEQRNWLRQNASLWVFFFFFFLGDPEWDHLCFTDLRLHLELLNEYEYS